MINGYEPDLSIKEMKKDLLKYYKKVKYCIRPSCSRIYGTDGKNKYETDLCPLCEQADRKGYSIFIKINKNKEKREQDNKEFNKLSDVDKMMWGIRKDFFG